MAASARFLNQDLGFFYLGLGQRFSTGGPQHVSRVGHGRLCILKMGLHEE